MRARAMPGVWVMVAFLWGSAAPATAHADLVFSCPGPREVVSDLAAIQLRFDGPLQVSEASPVFVTIASRSEGPAPELGPVELVGLNALVADIRGSIAPGEYTVAYEVVSADGDTNLGAVDFTFDRGDRAATNCAGPASVEEGGGGGLGGLLMIVAPLAVLGLALFGFNRWAAARPDEVV